MEKVILVLSLFVSTWFSCGKQDSINRQRNYHPVSYTVVDKTSNDSQNENSLVQLQKAGMSQMNFRSLQQALGRINTANFAIEGKTQIVLVETLNHNLNGEGFNKMIDNFNLSNSSNNEVLIKNYQTYADENCKKIYGCVGTLDNADYEWKIIKFLPNPEICTFEPTVTMSNVML